VNRCKIAVPVYCSVRHKNFTFGMGASAKLTTLPIGFSVLLSDFQKGAEYTEGESGGSRTMSAVREH
jgi:hypothetical protein